MGRKRVKGKRWARASSIWTSCCGTRKSSRKDPQIPHPEMHKRRFVLLPLAELAPHVIHPQIGSSVSALLATVPDKKRVTLLPRA